MSSLTWLEANEIDKELKENRAEMRYTRLLAQHRVLNVMVYDRVGVREDGIPLYLASPNIYGLMTPGSTFVTNTNWPKATYEADIVPAIHRWLDALVLPHELFEVANLPTAPHIRRTRFDIRGTDDSNGRFASEAARDERSSNEVSKSKEKTSRRVSGPSIGN